MKRLILGVCIIGAFVAQSFAQRSLNTGAGVFDTPTITITTGTATSSSTPTAGMHQATVQWTFGTVSGSYTTCTVQAKTSIDGTNYANLGSAASITVTTGRVNSWVILEPVSATPSTAAQGFGQLTQFVFACSGSYGTSAPVTVSVLYLPLATASLSANLSISTVGIDQTSKGVTNGVSIVDAGGVVATITDDGGGHKGQDVHISGGTITASFTTSGLADATTLAAINTAVGATSDAAASAGGTGTVNAHLREMSNQLSNLTVTANAGTNLNTSLLALESGGNLAAMSTSLGATSDAAVAAGAAGSLHGQIREISNQLTGTAKFQRVDGSGNVGPAGDVVGRPIFVNASATPATGATTMINSDSVGCATDVGCQVTPFQASYTDRAGTVTTGGTSQTLAATNSSRKRIIIENPCTAAAQNIGTAESLVINFTSAASTSATGSSFEIAPCGVYDSGIGPVSTEAVTVTAATTSHSWRAKEQ